MMGALEANPVRARIEEAKGRLEEHGWCQHQTRNDEGAYCLTGAVFCTPEDPQSVLHQMSNLLDVLASKRLEEAGVNPLFCHPLTTLNDEVISSREEAVAFLDGALEELDRLEES